MAAGGARGSKEGSRGQEASGPPVEYGDIHTAQLESRSRLDFLVADIYAQHGLFWSSRILDRPRAPTTQGCGMLRLHMLLSTRYLVLELWDFDEVYRTHYKKVMGGLEVGDRGGLHAIIGGHGSVAGLLGDMRNKFVAHTELGLGEFAARVNAVGLAPIVEHARAVLVLQDAIHRTIPNRHAQKSMPLAETVGSFGPPTHAVIRALKQRYNGVNHVLDRDAHKYETLRGLQTALSVLRRGFCDAVSETREGTLDSYIQFESHVHRAKYMILDMHNFIVEFTRLCPRVPRPGFLSRAELYAGLRNDYAAHTRANRVSGVKSLLRDSPGLLDDIILDMVEADILVSRVLGRRPDPAIGEINPMTGAQISEIERRTDDVIMDCHRFYGYRYFRFNDEAKVYRMRDLAKRDLGLT